MRQRRVEIHHVSYKTPLRVHIIFVEEFSGIYENNYTDMEGLSAK